MAFLMHLRISDYVWSERSGCVSYQNRSKSVACALSPSSGSDTDTWVLTSAFTFRGWSVSNRHWRRSDLFQFQSSDFSRPDLSLSHTCSEIGYLLHTDWNVMKAFATSAADLSVWIPGLDNDRVVGRTWPVCDRRVPILVLWSETVRDPIWAKTPGVNKPCNVKNVAMTTSSSNSGFCSFPFERLSVHYTWNESCNQSYSCRSHQKLKLFQRNKILIKWCKNHR